MFISQKEGILSLVYKKYNSFLYCHESVEMAAWERDAETQDCYDLHHVEIDIFRALLFLWEAWYRAVSQPVRVGTCPPLSRSPVYSLLSKWLTAWLFLSIYNFLNANICTFWFPIHTIDFCCPLFTQVQYPVLKSLTNGSVNM